MSTVFERRTFEGYNDLDGVYSYSDLEFKKCKFLGCSIGFGHAADFSRRTTAERVSIKNCEVRKCQIKAAVFREVLLEDIRSDMIMVYGALFDHVKFKGRCGKWLIHGTFMSVESTDADEARYQDLCDKFYSNVDWAVDISEAEFEDFDLRTGGVPAGLIRRDPETQVVIRRERVMDGRWRKLGLQSYTETGLSLFLQEKSLEAVLVVPKRLKNKNIKSLIEDLRKLQAEGIAEPN